MLKTDLKYKPKIFSEILNEKYETLQVQRLTWETCLEINEVPYAQESEKLIREYLEYNFYGVSAEFNYINKNLKYFLDGDEICPKENLPEYLNNKINDAI